ncbi:MAG: hypothetical protein E7240_02450 [Lachnospiraceae bacterium]|nr:hypothetical protein [Lachnospiraceae bacterium]
MALATLNVYSRALNMDTTMLLILPEQRMQWASPIGDHKFKVLYLLHGHCGDHTSWLKDSRIEWYLRGTDTVGVFPFGDRAFYVDGVLSHRYQTFLAEELPIILHNYFPLTDKPEETFIGGLSMGGYGSLNIAMNYPENYGGVIALSSLIDPFEKMDPDFVKERGGPELGDPDGEKNHEAIFGNADNFYGSKYDLYECMKKLNEKSGPKPKFLMLCGDNDFLVLQNRKFAETAKALPGIDLTYEESPGIHNWDFWDPAVVRGLQYFGIK